MTGLNGAGLSPDHFAIYAGAGLVSFSQPEPRPARALLQVWAPDFPSKKFKKNFFMSFVTAMAVMARQ